MYTPQPPSSQEPVWSQNPAIPAPPPSPPSTPPAYQPYPPYPPASPQPEYEYTGVAPARQPMRNWLRIPLDKPLVTHVLLAILVAIYVPMLFFPQVEAALSNWGEKQNLSIYGGEWYRLISATFLHGHPLHIFLNGYALYSIGTELEAFVGKARFIAIYFISGLAGSVASFMFSPYAGLGASGAIFGLVGALAIYFGLHRNLFGKLGQAQFWNIIVVIILNVALGFSGIFPIDNSAHIGGLLVGALVGYVLCPRYILGEWRTPNVRDIVNANKGALPWIASGLITLVVIAVFLLTLLLIRAGIFTWNIFGV